MNRDQYELKKQRLGDGRTAPQPPISESGTPPQSGKSQGIQKMATQRPHPNVAGNGGHK
ncbi:MAG TPA: hypothetical protein PK375_01995 [Rhodocyclaceae bacterium]|nr:hypothetical protein [Rhodocyclaceae bacterium]HNH34653.1 hypothetical protein [Rhodocyclaceae bacterium]